MKESLRIISRKNIDLEKWDSLVESSCAAVFNNSWYLDAVAENWEIIVDDNYSSGIALPFSKRMGVEILYTPIFVRWLEWLGDSSQTSDAMDMIRNRFRIIEYSCKQPLFGGDSFSYVFQEIDNSVELKISSQAERSLKKAVSAGFQIEMSDDFGSIQNIIKNELTDKYSGLTKASIPRLFDLFSNAKSHGKLLAFEVTDESLRGGIICLESKNTLLYLKGAVDEEAKKNGAMYLSMKNAIDYAREKRLTFDFGGSRIEGVKKFNHNLGGQDAVYHAYEINNGPFWFYMARTVKKKWLKK